MSKVSKQRKEALAKFDKSKSYSLNEAVNIVKQITYSKFDASVDLNIRLGVDPRKANQMVRGSVTLPHGTGKVVRVLVLCNPDKAQEALDAGADYVGLDEYIQKIKDGWTDIDIVITTPNIMPKVGALGRFGEALPSRGRRTARVSARITGSGSSGNALTAPRRARAIRRPCA